MISMIYAKGEIHAVGRYKTHPLCNPRLPLDRLKMVGKSEVTISADRPVCEQCAEASGLDVLMAPDGTVVLSLRGAGT